jgi:hypothetical protein
VRRIVTLTILAALMLVGFAPATLAQDEEHQILEESTVTPEPDGDAVAVRIIDLTVGTHFTQGGEQVLDIPVTPGETVLIRIDNVGGYDHNFYIGTDSELTTRPTAEELAAYVEREEAAGRTPSNLPIYPTTNVGIANWNSGVQQVEWRVPEDITGLKYGCTISSHYPRMQGTFSVLPEPPAETGS